MKRKILLVASALFLSSPLIFAQSAERIHYKCHLTLNNKSDVVHLFVTTDKTQSEFEKGLTGQIVYSADGVSGSAIERIYECVKADKIFKNKDARELERITPF
jgi:hypothetical protein